MNIKKDDKVIVLSGKDKGKQGEVLSAEPKTGKVIVKGVNIVDGSPKIVAESNGQTYQVEISEVRQVAESVL